MAEAVVAVALKTISDLLLEEGKFFLGVGSKVKALETQLKEMKCLLKDAGTKQHKSESVRNLIATIRDLVYRAEDAVAKHAIQSSSDGRLLASPRVLTRPYSRHQLAVEISSIMSELARITTSMRDYGLRSIIDGAEAETSTAGDNQDWGRITFPNFQMGDCFVGMENELTWLVSRIADDKRHRVVSVWGMGGIGKTTIARKVYNRMIEAKNRFFDCFAWVCITQQCHIPSVLKDVLVKLKVPNVSSLTYSELIEQLCEIQRAKRCLIVLDDLWETSHWNGLKHAFLVQDLKSKILITTRKQNVAEIGFSLQLGVLNVDDAWELLKKKAFPHDNISDLAFEENELQNIGKEMVRKCGCLPLAISLLGGVLSNKNSMREWEFVNENIGASLYRGGHSGNDNLIDGVLNLSYEDLPYYVKLCFLYLGVFKEDENIPVGNLYRLWIAQGMISHENSRGMNVSSMEIAKLYLRELASRSIVQVEVDDGGLTKKFKRCKLHDVVRELCLSMGQKEYYNVQNLAYEGGRFSALLHDALSRIKTRHLAIHFKSELQQGRPCWSSILKWIAKCCVSIWSRHHDDDELCEEDNLIHLRSLHMHNDTNGSTRIEFPRKSIVDFHKFKSLKSLTFVGFNFVEGKLPKGITDLIHLRYLCLKYCGIDQLQSSIRNLVYLETLMLSGSRNTRIPNVLKKMPRLKHLFLPRFDKEKIGDYRLRLDEGLDELETLMGFDSSVHELSSVTRMRKLRRFSAYIYDNESLSLILDAIATNWNSLVNCIVEVHQGCEVTSTEIKKAFTCPNLHTLGIYVGFGNLLMECRNDIISSNIGSLFLAESKIEEDPMDILGKLPSLTELSLRTKSFVGEEMTCSTFSFPLLRILILVGLPNLREWKVEEGAMPLLSQLELAICPRLEKVPEGLKGVLTLKELTIRKMPELAKRVFATGGGGGGNGGGGEGEDFHIVRHVQSIITVD